MSNLPTARTEVCMAYCTDWQIIGHNMVFTGFTNRCSFHTALASLGCVKDLRLVNHLVWLSQLVSKQLLLNNKFYALLDQL